MSFSVLVVDDDPMTLNLLRLILEPAGFRTFVADDGLDALEKVKQYQPDVLILDVMMPVMDGFTVCRQLRSNPETADLPIIILTTSTQSRMVAEGLRAGATKYVFKPVSRTDLIQQVNEAIALTRQAPTWG